VTPRDVSDLRARLEAAATTAAALAKHVEDLHSIAYERHVGDHERVSGGDAHPGVENVGDLRARALWAQLVKHAHHVEITLLTLERAAGNLLAAGPGAEDTRGSLISSAEHAYELRKQDRNRARGEFVPARLGDQPGYPGGGR
jgi:hypothetical protein